MNDKKYSLLTPSARSAFDEMKDEYGDALLEMASEIASHNNTGETEISLSDVMEARNSIQNSSGEFVRLKRKERMASLSLFIGVSYTFLGMLIYFATNEVKDFQSLLNVKYIWLLVVAMGMTLMIMPIVMNFERVALQRRIMDENRKFGNYNSLNTIVKVWSIIEKKGKHLMELRGFNLDIGVYDFLIHELNTREYIDNINKIISVRNDIVHTKNFEMKNEDVLQILNLSQSIINELDKRINEYSN